MQQTSASMQVLACAGLVIASNFNLRIITSRLAVIASGIIGHAWESGVGSSSSCQSKPAVRLPGGKIVWATITGAEERSPRFSVNSRLGEA